MTPKSFVAAIKAGRRCADCYRTFPACAMDFDHRDPAKKIAAISAMAGRYSNEDILQEMAKCDLVCACCHRVRTQRRALGQPVCSVVRVTLHGDLTFDGLRSLQKRLNWLKSFFLAEVAT